MKINEGNIFEAMRLVLPEHRGVMKGWQRDRGARKPPVLSEDAFQDMQYTLSEAIETQARVRLTLFGTQWDETLEGVLVYDGRLRIAADEGIHMVDIGRLIRVELV